MNEETSRWFYVACMVERTFEERTKRLTYKVFWGRLKTNIMSFKSIFLVIYQVRLYGLVKQSIINIVDAEG